MISYSSQGFLYNISGYDHVVLQRVPHDIAFYVLALPCGSFDNSASLVPAVLLSAPPPSDIFSVVPSLVLTPSYASQINFKTLRHGA
jgi:hypothetical protein